MAFVFILCFIQGCSNRLGMGENGLRVLSNGSKRCLKSSVALHEVVLSCKTFLWSCFNIKMLQ